MRIQYLGELNLIRKLSEFALLIENSDASLAAVSFFSSPTLARSF